LIIEAFTSFVKNKPEKVCVIDKHGYTYQEIYDLSIYVRDYIHRCKLKDNEGIGLIIPNSAFYVAVLLGSYMAGQPLILFDKNIKQYELDQFMIRLKLRHLIVFNSLTSKFEFEYKYSERLDEIECSYFNIKQDCHDSIFLAGDFICQFTSGTNGLSKACIRTEAAVFNEIVETRKRLDVTDDDCFLVLPPIHHSFGLIAGVLLPLCYGCSIKFIDQFIPADVLNLLSDRQVSVLFAVPFMYKILAESLKQSVEVNKKNYNFKHIKYCFSAGAILDQNLLSLFFSLFDLHIYNDYGSSEAGVICLNIDDKLGDSVGLPVDYKMDIVDESGNILPAGQIGEIRLSGKSLFRRYAIYNPEYDSEVCNGKWMTGDVGYKNEAGYVFVKGRARHMINVSGCKVDPIEVETVLQQYPGIEQAVVIGMEKEYSDQYLKAFIVAGEKINETAIYAFCKARLTDYKVPRVIQVVKEIPRTQTGKILRKDLINL
jgi:long-chain acyl-CoA synthetase